MGIGGVGATLTARERWKHEHWGHLPFLEVASQGLGILAAGIVLAISIVPFSTAIAQEALEALPNGLRQGALALGASRRETVRTVPLAGAWPEIAAGLLLALGLA